MTPESRLRLFALVAPIPLGAGLAAAAGLAFHAAVPKAVAPVAGFVFLLTVAAPLVLPALLRRSILADAHLKRAANKTPDDSTYPVVKIAAETAFLVGLPGLVHRHGVVVVSAPLRDRIPLDDLDLLIKRERQLARCPGCGVLLLHAILESRLRATSLAFERLFGGRFSALLPLLIVLAALLEDGLAALFRPLFRIRQQIGDDALLAAGVSPLRLLAAIEAQLAATALNRAARPAGFREGWLSAAAPFDEPDTLDLALSLATRAGFRPDRICPYLARAYADGRAARDRSFRKDHPGRRVIRLLRASADPRAAADSVDLRHGRLDDLVADRVFRLLPAATVAIGVTATLIAGGRLFVAGLSLLFLAVTLLIVHRERYAIGARFIRASLAELVADPTIGGFAGVPVIVPAARIDLADQLLPGRKVFAISDGDTTIPLIVTVGGPPLAGFAPAFAGGATPFHVFGYFRRDGYPALEALALPGLDRDLPCFSPRARRFGVILALIVAGAALTLGAL